MKKPAVLLALMLTISACDIWGASPQPFPVWTPIPTITPNIVTATPFIILPPSFENTVTSNVTIVSPITPPDTDTPHPTFVFLPAQPTGTMTPAIMQSVNVEILGCNTSIDILRGMGEVTNAFVTVKNNGTVDLPNTCALLRAIDEDRVHPDKTRCVDDLPAQHQVNLKLTVDSQYKVDTIIQVDISSNDAILLRIDKQSCRNIGLFGGAPSDLNVIKPINP